MHQQGVHAGVLAHRDETKEIQEYWTKRSETYAELNIEEMNNWKRGVWRDLILSAAPEKETLDVLDIGTGPGFFAINLALAGHRVTAVDLTEEMLKYARENAAAYGAEVKFARQRGESLPFADDSFDLIVNRNVTWNLEYPLKAFREWKRVLRPGGRMVYFDAMWYRYLFDQKAAARSEADMAELKQTYPLYYAKVKKKYVFQEDWMEEIARGLPLSPVERPAWDRMILQEIGVKNILVRENLNSVIYSPEEQLRYRSIPMFMVSAEK